MEVTQEIFNYIKKSIVEQAIAKGVSNSHIQRAKGAHSWDGFKSVIADDIEWYIGYGVTVPDGYYKNNSREFTIVDGERHGEYIVYYPDGKVYIKTNYVNGKEHGESIVYCSNGQVAWKCNYVKGKLHGDYVRYFENGKVSVKCNFVNGKEHGEYVSYRSNGQLWEKCEFIHGQKQCEI